MRVVTRESNFFELGGDSLAAGVVAARVKVAFGLDLDMLDFVGHPALCELAARISSLQDGPAPGALPPLVRTEGGSAYPLSFTQESIWTHCQTPAAHRLYIASRSYGIQGPLNVGAFREAMSHMIQRHEILRTTFAVTNGVPVQQVNQPRPFELALTDLSGLVDAKARAIALLHEEACRPFDLGQGPLVRFTLVRITSDEHWLAACQSSDSFRCVVVEVVLPGSSEQAYERILRGSAADLDPAQLQHGDYAAWERRVFASGCFRTEIIDWWRKTLSSQAANLSLPFARDFDAGSKASDGVIWAKLDPDRLARLERLAQRENTTSYVVGMAAFAALLASVTGRDDVTVGTHVTSRSNVALQDMQGNFARLVPVCVRSDRTFSFHEWLGLVGKQVADTQAHAQLPYEELARELRLQGVTPPEIQVIFGGPAPAAQSLFAGLGFTAHGHRFKGLPIGENEESAMPWGMTLTLDLTNPERPCELTFDARIYDPKGVRSFFLAYRGLIDRVSLDASQTLHSSSCSPELLPL